MNNAIKYSLLFLISSFLVVSCVKRDFDEPPVIDESADLEVNSTIAELKERHTFGTAAQIEDDIIIRGVVVSSDEAGNFFKVLIIQDETGGIEIQIDRVSLHDDYPIGREVFVKCRNLYMGDNNGTIQLGADVDASNNNRVTRIPDNLRRLYLFRGQRDQDASPSVQTINNLSSNNISTLIKLENVQFVASDIGQTLADTINQFSRNLTIEDCEGNTILIRTSGFADFANFRAPQESGSITAVFSVFGNDRQLFIRDTDDIQFDGDRCGSGPVDGELISIAELRDLYQGSTIAVPSNVKIRGGVISDINGSNITSRNVVIQEPGGAGITIRFDNNNVLAMGDEVEINISGVELSVFQGLLQLNNVPNNRANKIGTREITPPLKTISEILDDFDNLESTLVRIEDAEITRSSGNTFGGSSDVTDATGTMAMFTQFYAAFADNTIPVGEVNLTAIVSRGGNMSTRQLGIRNLNDIEGGDNGGGGQGSLNESFNNVQNNIDLNLPGWFNIPEIGSRVWRGRVFDGNGYAQATTFNSDDPVNVMWMITPEIELDVPKTLTFETAKAFWTHDALEVFVSEDFTGNNLSSATWVPIDARIATESDPDNTFIPSGEIDLSSFTGTIHIAFRHTGNNSNNTGSSRVDNVRVFDR